MTGIAHQNIIEVPVQPTPGTYPNECLNNVRTRIRAEGGTAVSGWMLDDREDYVAVTWIAHWIWKSPNGKLQCVTPEFTGVEGNMVTIQWPTAIQFVIDEAAWIGNQSKANRYVPKYPLSRTGTSCPSSPSPLVVHHF